MTEAIPCAKFDCPKFIGLLNEFGMGEYEEIPTAMCETNTEINPYKNEQFCRFFAGVELQQFTGGSKGVSNAS